VADRAVYSRTRAANKELCFSNNLVGLSNSFTNPAADLHTPKNFSSEKTHGLQSTSPTTNTHEVVLLWQCTRATSNFVLVIMLQLPQPIGMMNTMYVLCCRGMVRFGKSWRERERRSTCIKH
jgi:hypothetical protein